jgi:exodeoxyribonuclease V alpha subunit
MDHKELEYALASDGFSSLDRHFARFLLRLSGNGTPALGLAAALVSRQRAQGHVCFDLAAAAGQPLTAVVSESREGARCPELADWQRHLRESGVVATPGGGFAPLVLAGARLYLHRYWLYEQEVAAALLDRARSRLPAPSRARLASALGRLFPVLPTAATDWQKTAAAVTALRQLCIISGGPGTGKTHTVIRIMALLQEMATPACLRIGLAAPTGKAAARLQEAIRQAKRQLAVGPGIQDGIPYEAATIHRLLGVRRNSSEFRHHRANPLPLDVLIVDEASMVDLALMAKLLGALSAGARLVLFGDKDQLASVEAGAVLGDICGESAANQFSAALTAELAAVGCTGLPAGGEEKGELGDCRVMLARSYRFGPASGIGSLAQAVNAGDCENAIACLRDESLTDVHWRPADGQELPELTGRIIDGFRSYLEATSPAAAFAAFGRFRVLTALRQGKTGAAGLNEWVERQLARGGLVERERGQTWYRGRPVMVTCNHYGLDLYNGDIGLTLMDGEDNLRVFFPAADGTLRSIAPARMPAHETAYVLTVHKSQGSEFEEVMLLLPEQPSPVLTRELIYTAITRARSRFELWGGEAVFRAAVVQRTRRSSGLRDLLWS